MGAGQKGQGEYSWHFIERVIARAPYLSSVLSKKWLVLAEI
jgi:hypothetical protein